MEHAFGRHWPEYFMEAAGLGLFMVSACVFGTLLFHPDSPATRLIPDPVFRRVLMGLAMGSTAVAIIYSPWGKQSGAHINPSVTLAFLRLGKIQPRDALWYMGFQFAGAVAGVMLAALILGSRIADPTVNYVATLPGSAGITTAFLAEVVISGLLMLMILAVSNTQRLARYTGLFAGALVATYISVEAPISGMSMNPARTFGSALPGDIWDAFWIYLIAPPLGMLLASEFYISRQGRSAVSCAKLHHDNDKRCIFCGKEAGASAPDIR